ncbi:MAG: SAM-dependent methyltransferase, partial [Bacteroidales bacterium]|nr:SAM-dependent methyltransferase [Bacteroidales bacterium]
IFIDPARRSRSDKSSKVISLQEYEPNIVELKDELFKIAPIVLVKVSPMADIKLNLSLLPQTSQIHIVSVDNECKELLFVLQRNGMQSYGSVEITAVNLSSKGRESQFFRYTLEDEECARPVFASKTGKYLYEPNKSLLKGGVFKLLCAGFGVAKLAPSTHLYTSDDLVTGFPGKIFEIHDIVEFNKKNMKKLASEYPHADISARNFPLDTNALKKMSGIKDGGERHLFATTLNNGEKVVIIASIKR